MQKSALKSVNVQRTGKSILQMFAFSFFGGSHICRFLPILRPPTVPRSHFSYPKAKLYTLIISCLYLQIVTYASESRFCVGKWFFAKKSVLSANIVRKSHHFKHLNFIHFYRFLIFNFDICRFSPVLSPHLSPRDNRKLTRDKNIS